jgi:hypothetical protein
MATTVADAVFSDPNLTGSNNGLLVVLTRVAAAREMTGAESRMWVGAVHDKLNDVEIFSVREFIVASMTVNRRLHARGYRQLHFSTMKLMLRKSCDVMYDDTESTGGNSDDVPMPRHYDSAEDIAAEAARLPYAE